MRILGIDPGLQVCGYALLEFDSCGEELVEAGVCRIDPQNELAERLNQIAGDISEILERLSPDVAAVEELYSHYEHPRTSILMGHARGVILQQCSAKGIKVESYAATKIKKSLTGNGRATKEQMQLSIQRVLGLSEVPEPNDVADAIAVALCCRSWKSDLVKMVEER
ncbi:MAG: crossover junction endodeoxyribonuclease RuvC [Phycisphaerae bacterium]|nr:crossover junction endodeoxyribonuclease RuvC [Phycisphaerae bacterium]